MSYVCYVMVTLFHVTITEVGDTLPVKVVYRYHITDVRMSCIRCTYNLRMGRYIVRHLSWIYGEYKIILNKQRQSVKNA